MTSTDYSAAHRDAFERMEGLFRTLSDRELETVVPESKEASPGFEKTLANIDPRMAGALVGEYACHEHDVRGAVGRPGAPSSLGTVVATDVFVNALLHRVGAAGLPALQVHAGERVWGPAPGVAVTEVGGDPFELFRAVTGRRTAEQIQALDWHSRAGGGDVYLTVFSAFGIPESAIDE